jgi:hypothetical protein
MPSESDIAKSEENAHFHQNPKTSRPASIPCFRCGVDAGIAQESAHRSPIRNDGALVLDDTMVGMMEAWRREGPLHRLSPRFANFNSAAQSERWHDGSPLNNGCLRWRAEAPRA